MSTKFKFLEVHLPFDQHSKLEVRPGEECREAIAKVLRKRNIIPNLCRVYSGSDPSSDEIDLRVCYFWYQLIRIIWHSRKVYSYWFFFSDGHGNSMLET